MAEAPVRVIKPWGFYEVVLSYPGLKNKRITVLPGQRLSLQKHTHRQEFWSFVQGQGVVRVGDIVEKVVPYDSVHVPYGVIHRIENPGPEPLVLVETQTGDTLSEEDVVRLEDDYGR